LIYIERYGIVFVYCVIGSLSRNLGSRRAPITGSVAILCVSFFRGVDQEVDS
jgi:hypothetical protein